MLRDPAKRRTTGLLVSCFVIAGVLLTRAAFVQLGSDARLEQMARRQFQSKVLIQPRRGLIVDRNGEPLAANSEIYSLASNPSKVRTKRIMARLLAKATDIPYAKLLQRLEEKRGFVWIKRHLSESDMNLLRRWRIIDADGEVAAGFWLVKESQRAYPHGELSAHVLGDVNLDSEGLEGVELWMNERLRGKGVAVSAIKDALGRPAFIDPVAAKNVQDGRDGEPVSLTLDASLQFAVEEELRTSVRRTGSRSGTVIVMNAVNGEILAMANQPAFNPNDKGVPADRRRNRAVTDGYEPGSTLKAVLLASALAHGQKLTDHVFGEYGSFKVQGKKISEAEAHEKFGWISLKRMMQVSSNVGAAKLALKVGSDSYLGTLKSLGFGERSGMGFPGEIPGRVPLRRQWQPLTLANIGFGQGLLVTPMQMVRAYASFLNGGWLVQPNLIKMPAPARVQPPRRIFSQRVADQVLEALEAVTQEGGTGTKAQLPGYRVAGKTGTAQKVEPGTASYSRNRHVASFIGFAVEVEPKIVIFTSLDEPKGVYYASETAAPLFREVLNAVANRFSLPTREGTVPALLARNKAKDSTGARDRQPERAKPPVVEPADVVVEEEGVALGHQDSVAVSQAHPLRWQGSDSGRFLWKMPSLHSLTPREAIRALKGHHFHVEVIGTGIVSSQSPEEGKIIADGDTIRLRLLEP